jgi:hypothetical protein
MENPLLIYQKLLTSYFFFPAFTKALLPGSSE